jgi:hypothetical protein
MAKRLLSLVTFAAVGVGAGLLGSPRGAQAQYEENCTNVPGCLGLVWSGQISQKQYNGKYRYRSCAPGTALGDMVLYGLSQDGSHPPGVCLDFPD